MDDLYSTGPYDIREHNNVKAGMMDMYMSAGGRIKNNVRDFGGNVTYNYDGAYDGAYDGVYDGAYDGAYDGPYDQNSLIADTHRLYNGTYNRNRRGRGCSRDQYKSNGFYGSDLQHATGRAAYYLVPDTPKQPISGNAYDAPQRPRIGSGEYQTSEDQLRAGLYRDGSKGADPTPYFKCDDADPYGLIIATFNIVPMLALLIFILVIIIAATIALSVKLYGFVSDSIKSFTS